MSAGLSQPLVVVTEWGANGAILVGFLLLAISAAGCVYGVLLRRGAFSSVAALTLTTSLALAAAWCVPLIFSSDVYAYAAYGEMARLGLNPYARTFPIGGDALIQDAIWQWSGPYPVCVYGPAFVLLAKSVVGTFAWWGTLAQLQALRATASIALVACVPLAYAAYQGDRKSRLRAAATIGLNPVAIWCAAEGHNDALALALVLMGFALLQRRLPAVGAAIVAFSALVKLPGIAAAGALAVVDRRARIGAALGIAAVAFASLPMIAGIATRLAPHGVYSPQASLQAIAAPLGPVPALLTAAIAASFLAARGLKLLRLAALEGWVWLGLAAWVLVPNPYPWYALWLLAIAALAPRRRVAATAILLSFTSLLRYVPDAVAVPAAPWSSLLGIAAVLPLALLLV